MPKGELSDHINRVKRLAQDMNIHVPIGQTKTSELRADLAGLYVVAVAAAYEACVKEVIVNYATRHNEIFGQYALAKYEKLNSRINMKDLHRYANIFHPSIGENFKKILSKKKSDIDRKIGKDIEKSYDQILRWRHDFAHAGRRNTTLEEAVPTHNLGLRVIYCFDMAFQSV
jgi:RiboL-PSP-HEPN